MTRPAKCVVLAGAGLVVAARLAEAAAAAAAGDTDGVSALALGAATPAALAIAAALAGPGPTREGALMRLATAIQLLLVAAVPRYGLHLLLGLPVAFLAVELFETRLPARARDGLAALLVAP